MGSEILFVVSLFIHPGAEDAFWRFETKAAKIMDAHGGRIERVIRPFDSDEKDSTPHEIHIVSFPSLERFEAYREDPRLAELASLRRSAIAKTEITIGEAGEPYRRS